MHSVCIHDRLQSVLFNAVDFVEALRKALSITELCLWFSTLPQGSLMNGTTCDAFYVKVTMAITLEGRAPLVNWSGVFVLVCCSVICCVVWACTELICAVLC